MTTCAAITYTVGEKDRCEKDDKLEALSRTGVRGRTLSRTRVRGRVCSVVIFALYVLVGLTRPFDVLHSDLSREARADLVEKWFWRKAQQNKFRQKAKNKNTKT